jgi:hypothetical protein
MVAVDAWPHGPCRTAMRPRRVCIHGGHNLGLHCAGTTLRNKHRRVCVEAVCISEHCAAAHIHHIHALCVVHRSTGSRRAGTSCRGSLAIRHQLPLVHCRAIQHGPVRPPAIGGPGTATARGPSARAVQTVLPGGAAGGLPTRGLQRTHDLPAKTRPASTTLGCRRSGVFTDPPSGGQSQPAARPRSTHGISQGGLCRADTSPGRCGAAAAAQGRPANGGLAGGCR